MFEFTDRVVMITGAAGNLGSAVTRAFEKEGAKLVLIDRAADRLPRLFPEMVYSADHFLAVSVDLMKPEVVEATVEETVRGFGRIDVLVNVAGGFRAGTAVHETSFETWDFMLNLNARSLFTVARAVIPHMLEQGSGKIVSVAARAAVQGSAKAAAYSVSKSAVVRLTESMSAELKRKGINVNCVLPGTIDTPQNREAMPNADHSRWVEPEAIADVITFLASDAARAVHGAAIPVYGLS
jgi:NAD(P)-dependent dehydrogenase (short-subunit alcohol dehydrogenase family)